MPCNDDKLGGLPFLITAGDGIRRLMEEQEREREAKRANRRRPVEQALQTPHSNPDHDSLVVRFDQLEDMLTRLRNDVPSVKDAVRVDFAIELLGIIRGQVIK